MGVPEERLTSAILTRSLRSCCTIVVRRRADFSGEMLRTAHRIDTSHVLPFLSLSLSHTHTHTQTHCSMLTTCIYRILLLSPHRAQQFHCTESLHPPGNPVTAAVARTTAKRTQHGTPQKGPDYWLSFATLRSCSRYSVVAAGQLYTCFRNIHHFSQCRRRRKGQDAWCCARGASSLTRRSLHTRANSNQMTCHHCALLVTTVHHCE